MVSSQDKAQEDLDTETQSRHREPAMYDGGRGWSDAASKWEVLSIAGSYQSRRRQGSVLP